MRATHGHRGYAAFLAHRISGLALALFLPFHFLALGLALESGDRFAGMIEWTQAPAVKAAEWGLVMLLALHLAFGLRVMLLELRPWRGPLGAMIPIGAAASVLLGAAFLALAL